MKKYNFYLWLFALIGIITSCSQDENLPQSADNNRVSLSAGIDRGAQTRATTSSVTIKPGYKLRYVLEVWDTKTPSNLVHRNETTATDASAVNFNFDLTTAGDYKALLWADFVLEAATESQETTPNNFTHYADCFYKTDNLKTITLAKSGTDYTINAQPRDAYFACADIKKETGAFSKSVQLTRPFGHINIIEKDNSLLAKVASLTATYRVPQGFDVSTGQSAGTTVEVKPTVTQLATPENNGAQANLFSDYIFAPQDNQTTLGEIKLTFTSSDATLLLDAFTIPANMPVKRNKRTNISGSILHTSTVPSKSAKLSVSVNDMWSGTSEDIKLPDVWDGKYPTSEAEAIAWLGSESAGAGDEDGSKRVFTITAASQLAALHYLVATNVTMTSTTSNQYYRNATYELAADINLNNHPWTPLGQGDNSMMFTGIFDGQGHTIQGMNITGNYQNTGFFTAVGGVVKHLNVKGTVAPVFTSNWGNAYCGGIAGSLYFSNSCIAFCSFEGTVTATLDNPVYAGGIAGRVGTISSLGKILSCYSVVTSMTLDGTGSHKKGGIAGKMSNDASVIKGCCYQVLTGITNVYGTKEGNGTDEYNGAFIDAAGANATAVIDAMNTATPTGYDYQWQAGSPTDTQYPVLVPKP